MNVQIILGILFKIYPIIRPALIKSVEDSDTQVDDIIIKILDTLLIKGD